MVSFSSNTNRNLEKLAIAFCESLPERFREIRSAFESAREEKTLGESLGKMKLLVHKLAGAAGTFGMDKVSELSKDLEVLLDVKNSSTQALLKDNWDTLKVYLDRIEEESRSAGPGNYCLEMEKSTGLRPVDTGVKDQKIVYLVEQDSEIAEDLSSQLGFFGYGVYVSQKLEEVEALLNRNESQILIINSTIIEKLPKAKDELLSLKETFYGKISIIFVSNKDDFNTRLTAVRHGGDAFFLLPVDIGRLIDKIETLLIKNKQSPYHILIVDDDQEQIAHIAYLFQQAGMITSVASDPLQVIHVLFEAKPELILMDLYMPTCSGLELASIIRQMDSFVGIPIIFLSQEQDKRKQLQAIRLGGDDFITKPVKPEYLLSTVINRAERTRNMRFYMERDSLTGLLNHTHIKETLAREIARAERCGSTLCFAMIDVDRFKRVNDSFGHLTGDRVLKSLSRLLQERLRKTDIIGRYGGEEFAVILLNTNLENAGRIMDNIRENFSKIRQKSETEEEFHVTFSCGISEYPVIKDPMELTIAADRALYEAKEKGRNRVILAP